MPRTEVGQVVAVNRSNNDVTQLLNVGTSGNLFWLVMIKPAIRVSGFHRAKAAAACADVAHHHDGGCTVIPAFAEIGATRLFAHREQVLFT